MTNSNSTSNLAIEATAAGVVFAIRFIKRAFSLVVSAKLSCQCGKVEGEIAAKKEDTIRFHCYCEDCCNYAITIAGLDASNNKNEPMIHSCGETHLVQVCKSSVKITQGAEHICLVRQAPSTGMFQYYADCCKVPLYNTVDFLGFVGVLEDNLDNSSDGFYGPVCYCTKEATKTPLDNPIPDLFVGRFMWNVIQYFPWAKSGSFDHSTEPSLYWGKKQE